MKEALTSEALTLPNLIIGGTISRPDPALSEDKPDRSKSISTAREMMKNLRRKRGNTDDDIMFISPGLLTSLYRNR
jgi:hypothetical protein